MPLFHIHGLIADVLLSLSAGASIFCTPGFNALKVFQWLDEARPSCYTAVPTMHQAILDRAPHRTSMLQDLELGRPMEIDALVTAVQELGRMTGHPTPTIDLVLALVRQRVEVAGCYSRTASMARPDGRDRGTHGSGEVPARGRTLPFF